MLTLLLCALITVAPGEDLGVLDEGAGPPVLLVPGLSAPAYSYRLVTPRLHEAGLRTVVVEPLGVGDSSRPAGADYTLTAQAARLGAVLDALELQQVVAVAQGVSASVVFRLALARPELLAGIVSLEGGVVESALTPGVEGSLKLAKLVSGLGGKRLIRDRFADGLREASGDPSWVDDLTVRKYFLAPMRDMGGTLDALIAMSEQQESMALAPRLPEITVPVVLLVGEAEHEGALTPEELQLLQAGLVGLRVVGVPGAGHFLQEERPETVARSVIQLSADVSSAAPSPR